MPPGNRAVGRPSILAHCRAISRVHLLWIAYLTLAAILAIPMLLVEVPMSSDTLNHLARIHVLAHIDNDPDLARFFQPRDILVPYMGLDWLLTPLARVVPTLVAGRIAIVLLLWGTVGAVMVLQCVFTGRIGFEPLLTGLVSYNSLLAWGLLNYMLGIIGALLGLAAWHGMRRRPWLLRLSVFTAVATALYFTHLLALVLYAAMLAVYEAFGRPGAWRTPVRDWALLAAQFLPAALLWTSLAMVSPGGDTALYWLPEAKVRLLTSPFLFAGASGGLDPGMATFVICVFLLVRFSRTGVLRWDRKLAAPAAAFVLISLVLPTQAFGVFIIDLRFPVAAALLAISGLQIVPNKKCLLPVAFLLVGAMLLQIGFISLELRACDRQYSEFRAALEVVPRGSVLMSVKEIETPVSGVPCSRLRVYEHMPQLVTLERSGYSPGFFAQVTAVAVRDDRPTDQEPWPAHLVAPEMLLPGAYLLWMHLGNHTRPVPPGLTMLHSGSFFDLFSIPGLPDAGR